MEDEITKNYHFWRILGLLVGDRDTGINSLANTSNSLVENCLEKGKILFSPDNVYEIKPKSQKGRKLLRRIRFKGIARKVIEKAYNNLPILLKQCSNENFFQFLTGLYEADGTVTFRSSGKKKYLEVEIKLAREEGEIARIVARRLKQILLSEVKVTFENKYNVWRIRIYKELDVIKFFDQINPLIKNPKKVESFIETNARNYIVTCKIFNEIKKKWKEIPELWDLRVLKNPHKIVDLYLNTPQRRHMLIKALTPNIRKKVHSILAKKFRAMKKRHSIPYILKSLNLSKATFYRILCRF